MEEKDVKELYFQWLSNIVCGERFACEISYEKLLRHLHRTKFVWMIPKDENRAGDGEDLRYRFVLTNGYSDMPEELRTPCSVFEMIAALAIRCEEDIMNDPKVGNRVGQWFWGMITNLGLGSMTDDRYDEQFVTDILWRFLNREYCSDGEGGLFTVSGSGDMPTIEIWWQLCRYLNSIS